MFDSPSFFVRKNTGLVDHQDDNDKLSTHRLSFGNPSYIQIGLI
jgi:hypothetical protein